MKRIVVLGASIAGVRALEKIKEKDPKCSCTLISFDKFYPYNRALFGQLIARGQKSEAIYYKKKDFYEKNNIQVLLEQNVSRINFNRKKIFTEEKAQIDYDILIIADLPGDQWPEIKGVNKNNIFGLNKLKAVNDMYDALAIFETIVVQSDRVEGFAIALALLKQKKDVTLVTRHEHLLKPWLNAEAAQALTEKLKERGLTVIIGNEIGEILGESDAKAVRLKTNKVLASEVTLFADAPIDTKMLIDATIALAGKITVDENFRASVADVYAVDSACIQAAQPAGFPKSIAALESEGGRVAAAINGETLPVAATIFDHMTLETEGLDIQWLGPCEPAGITAEKIIFDPATLVYKGVFCRDNRAVGALLINAADKKELFARVIKGELGLEQIEAEFSPQVPVG